MILEYMKEYGSITPMEALDGEIHLRKINCFRLAARIDELRRDGHPIRTEMVEGRDGKRWAMYQLEPVQVELF
jgi:hypothetical protein